MSLNSHCRLVRFSSRLLVLGILGVIALTGASAQAALLITDFGSGGIIFNATADDANTLGFEFKVGSSALSVSSLGFFDNNSDGLPSAVMVGLWNTSSANQVAAVTVPAGTGATLLNSYRYVSLDTPVVLNANTTYTIGYRSATGGVLQDGRSENNQGISTDVTIPSGGFGLRHSFDDEPISTDFATQMPAMNLGDTVPLTGPNMQYVTTVPEPVGCSLILVGSLGVIARRKRDRSDCSRSASLSQ